jgi:hypothetical protein
MQISLDSQNVASVILHSVFEQAVRTQTRKLDENVIAAMNKSGHSAQARASLSEDLFSVHHVDAAQMKTRIFERLGEKFGLKQDDFETVADYARAIRRGVDDLKDKPGGLFALQKIEEDLGLDELGISIDIVIEAMIDPASDAAKELNEALEEKLGKSGSDAELHNGPVKMNNDGLYTR